MKMEGPNMKFSEATAIRHTQGDEEIMDVRTDNVAETRLVDLPQRRERRFTIHTRPNIW